MTSYITTEQRQTRKLTLARCCSPKSRCVSLQRTAQWLSPAEGGPESSARTKNQDAVGTPEGPPRPLQSPPASRVTAACLTSESRGSLCGSSGAWRHAHSARSSAPAPSPHRHAPASVHSGPRSCRGLLSIAVRVEFHQRNTGRRWPPPSPGRRPGEEPALVFPLPEGRTRVSALSPSVCDAFLRQPLRRADVSPQCVTRKRLGRGAACSQPVAPRLVPVLTPADPSGGVGSPFIGRFSSTQRLKERELLTCSQDPTEGQGRPVQASLGGRLLHVSLLPCLLVTPIQAWPQPPGHVPLPEHNSVPLSSGLLQATGKMCSLGFQCGSVGHWASGPSCGLRAGAGSQPSSWGKMWKASGDTGVTRPRVAVGVWDADWDRQLPETSFHVSPPCQPAKGEGASEWDRAEARACREEQAGE